MTQALINKLNIMPEQNLAPIEKNPKSEGMDFGKIFETKTNKFNTKNTDNNQTSKESKTVNDNKKQLSDNTNDNKTQISVNNEDTKTTVSSDNTNSEIITTEDNSVIQNCTDNKTQIDNTADTNKIITAENNVEEITEAVIEEEELNILADLITEETTIISEEPTMYKELNTLEDPTTVFILQSQIHKTVNTKEIENSDISENNISLKTSNQNLNSTVSNNTTAVFKQFDDVAKDVNFVNLTPKETLHAKAESRSTSSVISENMVKELNIEVISSQTTETESSMSDLMQNQSPQEQAARVMIQGDIKYEAVASEATKNAAQVKPTEITPSKIIEQIAKQLDGMVNNSKLNIVLNPGALGKVNVQLFNTKDGLTAQFTVTTQEAKDMLIKGLEGLKESLLAQGVSVDSVLVKLEEADSEYNLDYTEQDSSGQQAKHQQGFKKQKDGEKDFEQLMFELENEKNKV